MIVLDLFPAGVLQLWDAVANGYCHARRIEFVMGGVYHKLEWLRIGGDMVFLIFGALPITWVAIRSFVPFGAREALSPDGGMLPRR